jgi:hypothetical protein
MKPRLHRKPLDTERVHCPDCGKVYEGTRRVELYSCACGARWREDMIINGKVRPEYRLTPKADEKHTFATGQSSCPECRHPLDCASNFDKADARQPLPLDFTICINCAAILRFRLDFSLRRATLLECEALPDEALAMVRALSQLFPNGVPKKP